MNLPNVISLGRILAGPLTIWLMLVGHVQWAFWIFVLAGLSDALDGFIAKRFRSTSELGRYLDPIADKVLLVSIFITLGAQGHLPAWLVILVVSRDLLIVGGALLSLTLSQPISINPLMISKVNTALQIILASWILSRAAFGVALPSLDHALIYGTALTTVLSGSAYIIAWVRMTQANGRVG
jgi:cardiolipin synthase